MTKLQRVLIVLVIALPLGALAFWGIGSAFGFSHLWETPLLVAIGIGVINFFWPINVRRPPKSEG